MASNTNSAQILNGVQRSHWSCQAAQPQSRDELDEAVNGGLLPAIANGLRPHQRALILRFLALTSSGSAGPSGLLLADEMGMGKTRSAIAACCALQSRLLEHNTNAAPRFVFFRLCCCRLPRPC